MDELVVGTYEGFVLGYSLRSDDSIQKLKQTFATQSHTASVRCVSIAGKFLASGGTDDKIVVIDMKSRKEHTVLMNHDGTINTVAFTHGGTHLLSQPVTAIAVHPSDKMALSIGGDKTLRTWNLIKGRPAFTINLASKGVLLPTEIRFSPGGDRFSLISQQTVDVWTISKAGVEKRMTCNSKPTSVQWIDDERLYVGLENGNIITLTVTDTQALTYQAHKQRVKSLHYESEMLYSASSSGELKVWSVDDSKLTEICSCNASCRVTCVTLNRQNHLVKKEEKSDEDEKPETVEDQKDSDSDNSDLDEKEEVKPKRQKRKPGAFVSISYGDEEEKKAAPPPKKK
ncbi:p21-activated protein kinase-interacting protein 1-like protein, partial [Operophtera brumata]